MSSTTTEPNELQPSHPIEDRHAEQAAEAHERAEDRRGFFQRYPAAKPIVFLVAIVALLLVGWFWWESRHWESTDDAQIDGHIYPISARVSGHVVQVNFDDGQVVHKGDVLVQLDPTDYQVALQRAQADYADSQASAQAAELGVPVSSVGSIQQIRSAEADMQNAQAGLAAAQKQVTAAQAQVVEAQANAKKLNLDVERYQQLLGKI
jgi:membrane fusion protein (multidrug efflux system)